MKKEIATFSDKEEIMALWNQCFDDSPEFNSWYFDALYHNGEVHILRKNGEIVSMLTLFNIALSEIGNVKYIYGACTKKQHRGSGYMSTLLREILSEFPRCILIPASQTLFDYYSKFGFETSFSRYNPAVSALDLSYKVRNITTADIEAVNNLYLNSVKNRVYAIRDAHHWQVCLDMLFALDGYALLIEKDNKPAGYAFAYNEQPFELMEIVSENESTLPFCIGAVENHLSKKASRIFSPVAVGNSMPIGMSYGCDLHKNSYINLLFN